MRVLLAAGNGYVFFSCGYEPTDKLPAAGLRALEKKNRQTSSS
jgi:hypothetical protein